LIEQRTKNQEGNKVKKSNKYVLAIGILAVGSIIIGGAVTYFLGKGGVNTKVEYPQKNIPETRDPDFLFRAPETLENGAVKSVLKNWPNGNDREVEYYLMKDGEKKLVRKTTYFDKGIKESEIDISYGEEIRIKRTLWYQNGMKQLEAEEKGIQDDKGFNPQTSKVKLDGYSSLFWRDGRCRTRGEYRMGKQHGMWHEWNMLGIRTKTTEFSNGKMNGIYRTWNDWGDPLVRGSFKDGKRDGEWTFWEREGGEVRIIKEQFPKPDSKKEE
jgi:antitoxin component YwqK of YwqJK toxin-antitoxin module